MAETTVHVGAGDTKSDLRCAYVDESIRRAPPGLYLVAVVLIAHEDEEAVRHRVRATIPRRQPRFHWRDEGVASRRAMLATIGELAPIAMAYACEGPGRRSDRARAKCVARMTWDLQGLSADHVTFESREDRNDRKDAQTIERAKRAAEAAPHLRYTFRRPLDEPLLWVADALAGVASAHIAGERDGALLSVLPDGLMTIVTVAP